MVTASVSYSLEKEKEVVETHLLESGKRLKKLNFNKAPWPQIKEALSKVEWEPMNELAKASPTSAHSWFINTLVPILESLVPRKAPTSVKRRRVDKQRKLLWRKLSKVKRNIKLKSSFSKLSRLIQVKWNLEEQLRGQYDSLSWREENQVQAKD